VSKGGHLLAEFPALTMWTDRPVASHDEKFKFLAAVMTDKLKNWHTILLTKSKAIN